MFGFTPDCKYPVVYGERGIVYYEILTPFAEEMLEPIGEFVGDQARDHVPDDLSVRIDGEEVRVTGKRAPSNAPELGMNAITLLAEKINQERRLSGKLQEYFLWLEKVWRTSIMGKDLVLIFRIQTVGN